MSMVTISFKSAEILDIVVAIGSLEKDIAKNYSYSMYGILKKFKKAINSRADKSYIQFLTDEFIQMHKIPITTYKKK